MAEPNLDKSDWRLETLLPPCFYCKHLTGTGTQSSLEGWTCSAFPEGIPYVILSRNENHDRRMMAQNGNKVFESKVYDFEDGRNRVTFDGEWHR